MNIKEALRKLEVNQSKLSKLIGVNPSQVSLWSNSITQVPEKHAEKINKLLKEKEEKNGDK